MKKLLLISVALIVAFSMVVMADPSDGPTWWHTGNTTIIDGNSTANNYAPANLGQLKNVATKAKTYLDTQLSSVGGAGPVIDAMVSGFSNNTTVNYQPINLGQLKAVARPFYDRLLKMGYDTRANLIANGYNGSWAYYYPWDPATNVSVNYSPANLGQLKMVFSFDLSIGFSGNVSSGADADGDNIPAYMEAFSGTNPTAADTDGDGINDDEDVFPLDPAFNAISSIASPDTSYPQITLFSPVNAVLVSHYP